MCTCTCGLHEFVPARQCNYMYKPDKQVNSNSVHVHVQCMYSLLTSSKQLPMNHAPYHDNILMYMYTYIHCSPGENLPVFSECQSELRTTHNFLHVREARDHLRSLGEVCSLAAELTVVPVTPRPHTPCGGEWWKFSQSPRQFIHSEPPLIWSHMIIM